MLFNPGAADDYFRQLLEHAHPEIRQQYFIKCGLVEQLSQALQVTQKQVTMSEGRAQYLADRELKINQKLMDQVVSARSNKAAMRLHIREGRVLRERVKRIIHANAESVDPTVRSIMQALTWMTDAF